MREYSILYPVGAARIGHSCCLLPRLRSTFSPPLRTPTHSPYKSAKGHITGIPHATLVIIPDPTSIIQDHSHLIIQIS